MVLTQGNKLDSSDSGQSVTVVVQLSSGTLSISATLPNYFKNKVAGLFGNFNGDASNDFTFRNGTQLPSNSADRAFNAFALSWQVLRNETVFRYNETNAQPWGY